MNEVAYQEAVAYGRRAAGAGKDPKDPVVDVWVGHVRKYADDVPGRIAGELVDTLETLDDGVRTLDEVLQGFDAKLESLRSSVTRYAEPTWGAGNQGYGEQLRERNILMAWILGDAQHCDDCIEIAAGSPYENLPTWPGMGDTQCLDRCKCTVEADPDSWDASLSGEADDE